MSMELERHRILYLYLWYSDERSLIMCGYQRQRNDDGRISKLVGRQGRSCPDAVAVCDDATMMQCRIAVMRCDDAIIILSRAPSVKLGLNSKKATCHSNRITRTSE
jgi:hypothetical protein